MIVLGTQATVVAAARQEDEIVRSEVSGPVVTVQPVVDESEARHLASGVPQGLAASVWIRDHPLGASRACGPASSGSTPTARRCRSCRTAVSAGPPHRLAPKFWVHQGPPEALWTPTPMSLNEQLRMLARWPGLFIQDSITASGVCWPMAMFSPYVDQV